MFRKVACLGELKTCSGKLQLWEKQKHVPESCMFGRIKNMFRKVACLGELKICSGKLQLWEKQKHVPESCMFGRTKNMLWTDAHLFYSYCRLHVIFISFVFIFIFISILYDLNEGTIPL
jgi:hypothetical protein